MRRRVLTIIAIMAVLLSAIPVNAAAVKAPAKVKTFTATTYSNSSIRLTWKKPGKCSGYAVYQNGKFLRRIPNTWTAYNVPKLKAATTYKYTIKTYNTYKRTQYYNSKYEKWQYKKPSSKQWKDKKTRKVTAYKYSKASVARSATTGPAKVTGLEVTSRTHNSVTLKWNKQTKAVTGYVLYRDGEYVATIGKNTTTYKNTGLAANKTYSYRMRSYYKVGSKNVYGAYSATVKVTTSKAPVTAQSSSSTSSTSGSTSSTGISASSSSGSSTVQDTKFKNSSLSNKTLYIDKENSYESRTFTLQTSHDEDADAITWKSSNVQVVTIERSRRNGTMACVTVVGKGTATITATNWDGQKNTATVTVKSSTDTSGSTQTGEYVTITDYKGYTRQVLKNSAEYNNPRYNINIDGSWMDDYTTRMKHVQKRGIHFIINHSFK